ncbi:MAG: deoxyribonuclease IV [Chloroflexi bacterium]|nr:MAG: deoxyribonuclease IV [Chloroflexota bacterium]
MLLGAHLSIAGGVDKAFDRAEAIQCTAFQIFTKSNRQWKAKPLDEKTIARYHQRQAETGIKPVICHASYLINIGATDDTVWQKSVDALLIELERCESLGIPYLVLHPGAHMGQGVDAGIARVVQALDLVHDRLPDLSARVALEITAGQGSALGANFEEIARILNETRQSDRLAVCFDTCHALAAGYEFRTPDTYEAMIAEFDRIIGLDRLTVVHVNDSVNDLGSRVDRHAHIGEGCIGLEPFGFFLNDPRLKHLPFLLETPKDDDPGDDIRNLEKLRSLVRE